MHEIKKINPNSLAKYISIITAVIVFIFGIINFILDHFDWGYNLNISIKQKLINFGASVLFFYILFWVIGYLSALVYNLIAKKNKGLVLELKSINTSNSKQINSTQNKKDQRNKFVV